MRTTLELFAAVDHAYNARDWEAYAGYLDEGFRGWGAGAAAPEGKITHIRNAQQFCSVFPDNRVHNAPYLIAISDGESTSTVAKFTGMMTGELQIPGGKLVMPTERSFELSFATFARWANGRIVEEYEFLDLAEIMRQIGAEG